MGYFIEGILIVWFVVGLYMYTTLNMEKKEPDCNQKSSEPACQCSELKAGDVPGSHLPRSPEKCKVNELRSWLQCRGQRVKLKETKAELCLRVRKCMENEENLPLRDIFPDQPYVKKKKANCSSCSALYTDSSETVLDSSWTRSTDNIPKNFTYLDILEFSRTSGKSSSVEKPIEKGYRFFFDGYIFSEEVSWSNGVTKVRCYCYRSMRKNEPPHKLSVTLDEKGKIMSGTCSCVAGVAGQCNHVYALLYKIEHVVKMKDTIKEFKRPKTCTQKPSAWQKSRTDGIRSEPVMTNSVVKPKFGSEPTGIKPTLYEARAGRARENMDISAHIKKLKEINPLFGVCQTVGAVSSQLKTRTGISVPKGSPLSYHLSVTEGDFKVCENVLSVTGKKCPPVDGPPPFPWEERTAENLPEDVLKTAGLLLSHQEASDLCMDTVKQADCPAWFDARKNRLTASKFGLMLKRKKDRQSFVKSSLLGAKDLSNIPSVRYGKENESRAVKQYSEYMKGTARTSAIFHCGCIVNPNFPWLAATPDRIIYSKEAGFGLMEIKCSYSKKNITPEDACFDPSFYCNMSDGKFTLKRDHEYYAQVQGQLGVCGAQYCDFVVYTGKGLGVERIKFDEAFWLDMTKKLRSFYLNDFYPVISKQ